MRRDKPFQTPFVGMKVWIHFKEDVIPGKLIRQDVGIPNIMLFELNDGRTISANDCDFYSYRR
ncbi:hypothetical protein V1503_24195 [Bacillus sp. SCS-151]|uniref:hypothetical protein n=1 Tax=Nanhaiella sioensis TaxID=3115293 RepID=UPI003979AB1F